MLQVARLARGVIGEEAAGLVESFLRSAQNEDGGFKDREGKSDLYYTCFAIDALTALQVELPVESLRQFLNAKSANLDELDFVHLCCLVRALSALEPRPDASALSAVFERIERFRTPDGGYNQSDDAETGSAYGCFLAYGAYSDHGLLLPMSESVAVCLESLRTPSGGWANDVELPIPNVPATAAAVTLLRNLRLPVPPETPGWILGSLHHSGGFLPFPMAPVPDLLSTAVALHALDGLQVGF